MLLLHLLTHLLPKCTKYKFHDLSMALASLLWQIQEQKHIALSSFPARTLSNRNSPITMPYIVPSLVFAIFNKKTSARKPSKEFFYFHVLPILVHDVPSFLTTRNQKHTHSLSTTRNQKKNTHTPHVKKYTHTHTHTHSFYFALHSSVVWRKTASPVLLRVD